MTRIGRIAQIRGVRVSGEQFSSTATISLSLGTHCCLPPAHLKYTTAPVLARRCAGSNRFVLFHFNALRIGCDPVYYDPQLIAPWRQVYRNREISRHACSACSHSHPRMPKGATIQNLSSPLKPHERVVGSHRGVISIAHSL
jgi:hypothetical protein